MNPQLRLSTVLENVLPTYSDDHAVTPHPITIPQPMERAEHEHRSRESTHQRAKRSNPLVFVGPFWDVHSLGIVCHPGQR